ncbi:MAG: orotidine 5'-phosphate decarboxylase [candidate division NC10 bacterium RBG_16_65_8]|nr:MAG: orotidine 5'-phosphate decarboxylase [candidate division NC10 bacterium RBG_16_65_8]
MSAHRGRLIVPLDVPTLAEAVTMARRLAGHVAAVKIGKQLFTAEGPAAIRAMHDLGLRVFLDLKYHDIPNTVAGAVAAAKTLGVWLLNVHASGGTEMMRAAAKAAAGPDRPLVIAVTVLTSLSEDAYRAITATSRTIGAQVRYLARETKVAGLDGVVASPHEIRAVRQECGPGFLIVTPGVRPADAALNDQQRVMTPGDAVRAGADYLVIGRPITAAPDPVEAARHINAECGMRIAE